MRIAIVSDAWYPQVNGVVNTLTRVGEWLEGKGHAIRVIHPGDFRSVPCPTYPEIRLALFPRRRFRAVIERFAPDALHIATEGPLGHAARRWARRTGRPFTTSYHTQFPRYLRMRAPVPEAWSYAYLRRFHGAAARTLVPTLSVRDELERKGFDNLVVWGRGVNLALFRPRDKSYLGLPRPIALYVGRVAVEKNLEAFLRLDLPGSKVVVGDGPDMATLRARYPDVHYLGYKYGEELARHLATADVFVFPSRTDTFGLVMLEAMACGVPVAAYPVTGPRDVVLPGVTGVLNEDLGAATRDALKLDPSACVEYARQHTWAHCAEQFFANLAPFDKVQTEPSRLAPRDESARPGAP